MIKARKFITSERADSMGFYNLLNLFDKFPELENNYVILDDDDEIYMYKKYSIIILDYYFDDDLELNEEEAKAKLPHLFI